jgi:hypothetical protein
MALASIKDHEIIEAMKTRFKAIAAGADYYYTYKHVTDWYTGAYNKTSDSPSLDIKDDEESLLEVQESSETLHDIDMLVHVDIMCHGKNHVENIRKMKADILKNINTDLTWGGLAFHTTFISSERNVIDQLGRKVSDMRISIGIHFRKNAWSN